MKYPSFYALSLVYPLKNVLAQISFHHRKKFSIIIKCQKPLDNRGILGSKCLPKLFHSECAPFSLPVNLSNLTENC